MDASVCGAILSLVFLDVILFRIDFTSLYFSFLSLNSFYFLSISRLIYYYYYTQYVNRAATAVRGAVNEPLKSKLAQQEIFTYKAAKWEGGVTAPKEEVTALSMAGKM